MYVDVLLDLFQKSKGAKITDETTVSGTIKLEFYFTRLVT